MWVNLPIPLVLKAIFRIFKSKKKVWKKQTRKWGIHQKHLHGWSRFNFAKVWSTLLDLCRRNHNKLLCLQNMFVQKHLTKHFMYTYEMRTVLHLQLHIMIQDVFKSFKTLNSTLWNVKFQMCCFLFATNLLLSMKTLRSFLSLF